MFAAKSLAAHVRILWGRRKHGAREACTITGLSQISWVLEICVMRHWCGSIAMSVWIATAGPAAGQEISFFRHDHGVVSDRHPLPENFSSDAVLQWQTPLPPGHSTPCVSGDWIFVTTYQAAEKELATVGLDRATGKVRWRKVVPTQDIEPVHASGSPAVATPACNGQQVFAFFGSYGLLCYDLTGNLLWEKPMGPFQDEFGAASSPILIDNKVILNEDHDIDSFITAIDANTGQTLWRTAREDATRSYSTPFILQRDGSKQILIAGSLQLSAYDPETGEKVWWYNGLSRIVDCTPVVHEGKIYIATWTPGGDPGERISMEPYPEALKNFDRNQNGNISKDELPGDSPVLDRFFRIDLNQNQMLEESEWNRHAEVFEQAQNVAIALEPGTRGPLAPQYVRWIYTRGLPTVPSSVVYDGVMTMVKDTGIMTILDVKTGKQLHQGRTEGRGNYYASLVAGDGKVYLVSENGVMTIVKSGPSGKILASHDFGERTVATPVIAAGTIYVRTVSALYSFKKR
jgi:outer membrane protein assembly factor BamB